MVKGISRQVIVVKGAEQALFEQAIFILKDRAVGKRGVTDAQLLREADRLMAGAVSASRAEKILAVRLFINHSTSAAVLVSAVSGISVAAR